ncbi:MAG: hypothetical protein K2X93_07745 [Candidatus Obscuribacterales bacterium]|nr:hypothetical protein [Candidatus Obscuribacterales bacterium]
MIFRPRHFSFSRYWALYTVLAVASVISTSGCGNDKSVTFKSAGMTHTFNEGTEGIPKDLQSLVYPGAQIAGSTSAQDKDGEHAAFVSLSTPDAIERVSEWYQSTLPKSGWQIDTSDTGQSSVVSLSGHQKDVEINVLMAQDGNKTAISISEGRSVHDPVEEEEIENFTPNELTPPTE